MISTFAPPCSGPHRAHTAAAQLLQEIMGTDDNTTDQDDWHTIFILEGLLIYLDDPNGLLRVCADEACHHGSASLCLADRLADVPGGDGVAARQVLQEAGWTLVDWKPKPGLARHMGVARLASSSLKE